MKLFEWHSESFQGYRNQLPGFIKYLSGVWQSRNRYYPEVTGHPEEDQQQEKIQKQRFFNFTVDGMIAARNYVGVVQYEDIRIAVYPKIFAGDTASDEQQWQINLLYWLSYCRRIKFPFSLAHLSAVQFDDLLELMINIFVNYTTEVISHQPFQAYQTVEEELPFLRGQLSFDKYIKHNLVTGKWQHFYCSHQPFLYDNPFNRLVKYVANRLAAITASALNREKLNELLFLLDDVSNVSCTAGDCDKVKLNPLFEDHHHVLSMCRLFLSGQTFDINPGADRNFCFMLPMEYIFEDFLFGFITEKWPALEVKGQSWDYLALHQNKNVFQIRNDLYLPGKLIIDAKYKTRASNDGLKAGVSQADMYQMISYAITRNCPDVLLLYPATANGLNEPATFTVPSSMLSNAINILVRNLDITFPDIAQADHLMIQRINALHAYFKN